MKVVFHPDAESEHFELSVKERVAVQNVIEKLEAEGLRLGYPHSSQVKGTQFRELRPRAAEADGALLRAGTGFDGGSSDRS